MFIFACFNLFAIIMFMVKFVWDVEENRLLALRGVNKMFDICHLPRLNVKEYMRQYGDDTDTDTDSDTDDEDNAADNNKDTDDEDHEHEHEQNTNTEAVTQMINDYKEYKKDESFSKILNDYIVYKQDIVKRSKIVEDYEDDEEAEEADKEENDKTEKAEKAEEDNDAAEQATNVIFNETKMMSTLPRSRRNGRRA